MSRIKRIVVIGPESTGKSTLSEALARELDTTWVPEYARRYLEGLNRAYNENDLLEIARGQLRLEDEIAQQANKILICDTDLHIIKIWSEAKFGRCNRWILEQIAQREYDMYLLANIDTAWQDDPLREHPAPHERLYFYNLYKDIVQNSGKPWIDISGLHEDRVKRAIDLIRLQFLL